MKARAGLIALLRPVTDPDSRILRARRGWIQGYNAQFAVSADYLIMALTLTNQPADVGQLPTDEIN